MDSYRPIVAAVPNERVVLDAGPLTFERVMDDPHAFHVALNAANRRRLAPAAPGADWEHEVWRATTTSLAEGRFIEHERRRVHGRAAQAPRDPAGFAAWFEELQQSGPGQYDPLFDFIAERATLAQMRWFVRQEVAGEAGFEDLVALTQVKMPEQAKLELARNYWDEMGRGKAPGMHGPMLARLARTMDIVDIKDEDLVWEALALGNLLVGLAHNRRYAFHAVGALGAVELTAPTRAVRVVEGLERLGIRSEASHYFRLHSTIDVVHWRGWKREVLLSLMEATPELGVWMAEGALMRLNAGARTFDRYRQEFGIGGPRGQLD